MTDQIEGVRLGDRVAFDVALDPWANGDWKGEGIVVLLQPEDELIWVLPDDAELRRRMWCGWGPEVEFDPIRSQCLSFNAGEPECGIDSISSLTRLPRWEDSEDMQ